uniref:Uncharacterized protein n=1 Tax=Cyanistes caeruleus TaxID=156563 RepID=A0A8C0ZE45_CYACU
MLCLLGVMLSVLCLVSPAPHSRGRACPANALFKETIQVLRKLSSKNNTMEAGGNAATYLEGFIEALKNSKESVEERLIVRNLQKIQAYGESCTGWMELHQNAVEELDFFNNLEYLLRFLVHNALPEETS